MKNDHPFPSLAVINLAQKHLLSSSLVLDVGCNRGQMGKILKEKNGCQVIGIDHSPAAVKKAKQVLDQAILSDVESSKFSLGNQRFDLILLSNILEHLKNPPVTLKRLKKYLKPDGFFLIALPNIAFWPVRLNLLFGKFEYEDQGILNKDHLRFFTFKTIKKLIEKAGLEIKEATTNYLDWRDKIAKLWPTLLASQFVALCSFPSKNKKLLGKTKNRKKDGSSQNR